MLLGYDQDKEVKGCSGWSRKCQRFTTMGDSVVVLLGWPAELQHNSSLTPLPQTGSGEKIRCEGLKSLDKDGEITIIMMGKQDSE